MVLTGVCSSFLYLSYSLDLSLFSVDLDRMVQCVGLIHSLIVAHKQSTYLPSRSIDNERPCAVLKNQHHPNSHFHLYLYHYSLHSLFSSFYYYLLCSSSPKCTHNAALVMLVPLLQGGVYFTDSKKVKKGFIIIDKLILIIISILSNTILLKIVGQLFMSFIFVQLARFTSSIRCIFKLTQLEDFASSLLVLKLFSVG